jgi:hypothetical protein
MAFAMGLAACSVAPGVAGNSDRHRIMGAATSVTVLKAGDRGHAYPFAEQYCESLGMEARFNRLISHRLSRYASSKDAEFDCVATAHEQSAQASSS